MPRQKPTSSVFRRLAGFLFRPGRLCVAAVVMVTVIGWPWLRQYLPDLATQPEYVLTTDNIHVTELPDWMPSSFVNDVHALAGLPDQMSLLDDGLVASVADAFRRHPWVRSVERVEKHMARGLVVELEYRRPVGLVEVHDGLYPIDGDGVLLPPRDFRPTDAVRYPIISNITSIPTASVGRPWGDPAVLGAARLAATLTTPDAAGAPYWVGLKVSRIEAPVRQTQNDRLEDLIFRLHSEGGSRIVWGRAPGTGHPGEVTARKKLLRLEKYLADYGTYETAHGPSELDIRHWHEISHRALAESPGGDSRQ